MLDRLVAGNDTFDDDFELDTEEEPLDEFDSRPVPGLATLLLNRKGLIKPYPINIYNFENDSTSGIAGTLYPDGSFVPLPGRIAPRTVHYWDEVLARKVPGDVRWDGVVAGTISPPSDYSEGPSRRLFDANSITGPWPNHPPRLERIVNPDKAREAAREAEENKWN